MVAAVHVACRRPPGEREGRRTRPRIDHAQALTATSTATYTHHGAPAPLLVCWGRPLPPPSPPLAALPRFCTAPALCQTGVTAAQPHRPCRTLLYTYLLRAGARWSTGKLNCTISDLSI